MQRIQKLEPTATSSGVERLLKAVKSQMGLVPNIIGTLARSESSLEAYLGFSGALAKGKLDATLREQIALTAAGANECNYCASVHVVMGGQCGLSSKELMSNLKGTASDPKSQAALTFVKQIVEKRGQISDVDLTTVRESGFDDEEIIEIMANTVLNIFTNYFNHIANTEIDFPVIDTKA